MTPPATSEGGATATETADGGGSGPVDEGSPVDEGGIDPVRRNQTAAFVVVTLAVSWAWWAFAALVLSSGDGLSMALIIPGGFGPFVGGLAVTWASGGDVRAWLRSLFRWRVGKRWYLAALGVPLAAVAAIGGLFVALGLPMDLSRIPQGALTFPLVLLVTLLVGGGNEEPGWRGFALPRLQAEYGALTASLAIGVVWAVWHYPLFAFDAARNASGSFVVYAAMVLAFSVVLTWIYNATGGSVVLVALAHSTVNAGNVLLPVTGQTTARSGLVVDLVMLGVYATIALVVVARYGPETLCADERIAVGDDRGRISEVGTADGAASAD